MVGPDFFDAFVSPSAGYLPGLEPVTIKDTSDTTRGAVEARMETLTENLRLAANIAAGEQGCVWFIAVGQSGYVMPGDRWKIVQADGTAWMVVTRDLTIQGRGLPVICTKEKT
jgi:hypothetical protein